MSLTDAELERYARHIVLPRFGGAGQQKLKAASVAVIGAGGIGSGAIPALAAAGIGRLTIIDNDVVDRSNLQRQPIFRDDQVGGEKAQACCRFCFRDQSACRSGRARAPDRRRQCGGAARRA